MSEKLKIDLVENRSLTRFPCAVCVGWIDRVYVLAEGKGEHGTIRVCEGCLEAGDVDARLQQTAAMLEARANYLRGLVGRLDVPTFQQWSTLNDRINDRINVATFAEDIAEGSFDAVMSDDDAHARWKAAKAELELDSARARAPTVSAFDDVMPF